MKSAENWTFVLRVKLTGEVVVKGESAGEYRDIGTRRVFKCDNCEQRQVIVGHQEYVRIGDDVKTIFIENRFFKKF